MTSKLFSDLGLSAEVLKAIDRLGFEQAAPIQAEAIPVLLQGRDVVGQSQTGSGKTAAFAVPAIEKVDVHQRVVQVLILCPTRELAVQVSEEVHKLAFFKRGIHALPIYGGQSYERQFLGLKQGAQIVIGTPGRVMDHMRRGTLRLDAVKMVILDEADVMLDMGFREDIEFILQAVPVARQTVFFSATIPSSIEELIRRYARDPLTIRIEQKTVTVPTVEQVYYEVDRRFKVELLTRLIDIHDLKLGIIFCNTKRMVDDLVDHLNAQGYSADRLHGDMSQAMRDRVMNKFRKSGLEFLVATDVAARGIDVDDVEVVFNYDLPYDVGDYVHRIGRTGRAGRSGRAVSFVSGRELFQIQHIERYTKTRIHRSRAPSLDEVEEARVNVLLDKLRAILKRGEFKRQDHLVERLLEEGFTSTDLASALLHQLQMSDSPPAARNPRGPERPFSDRESPRSPDRGRMEPQRPERRVERPPSAGPRPESGSFRDHPDRPLSPVPKAPVGRPSVPPPAVTGSAKEAPATALKPERAVAKSPIRPVMPKEKPAAPESQTPQTETKPDAAPATSETEPEPAPPRPPKPRRTPSDEHTRLHMNIGELAGVTPADVVTLIMGETGLSATVVGLVDVRERHLFVEVASLHVKAIITKLNRARLKDCKLKVKVA